MKRDFYTTPKSTPLMRLLWSASGGDRYILERATYSDQIKYMCLGGIIVATGLMAALAGGYAFYTIFEPRGSAIESQFSWTTTIISIFFGCFWGLMIFNLDRFIVSSTGKGDGTEAITWDEFKGAIPRLILGAIIALTISKPIEIRMFKTEIDVKLYEKQLEAEKNFKEQANANFEDRVKLTDGDLNKIEEQRNQLQKLLSETTSEYNKVASKKVTRWTRAYTDNNGVFHTSVAYEVVDPSAEMYEKQMDKISKQLDDFDKKNADKLKKIEDYREKLLADKDKVLGNNKKVAAGLDGLLERLHLAHEVAGFWISLFITLLFMSIELTPIFFKLMLVKSPYDFLKENVEELMKAEQGIHIEYNYHKDKEGQERDLVTHLHKEKLLVEKKSLQKVQEELTEYAISKYREEMKKKIDANPEQFIKIQENSNNL
jgi:hypothetical protein